MIYTILSFFQLFFAGQPVISEQSSLLWKVTSEKSAKVSYLYGTMHVADPVFTQFPDEVSNALFACDVFACEVDIDDLEESEGILSMILMKDVLLKDLYTQEEWEFVSTKLKERMDPIEALAASKMKPFFTMALLDQTEAEDSGQIMDDLLTDLAREADMGIVALETFEEVMGSIDAISLKEQAAMLYEQLKSEAKTEEDNEMLRELYYNQDLSGMLELGYDPMVPPKMMEVLLEDRNKKFADRLKKQLKKKSVFCAVGAMHLPGETGLIQSLKDAGYKVEPVPFSWGN